MVAILAVKFRKIMFAFYRSLRLLPITMGAIIWAKNIKSPVNFHFYVSGFTHERVRHQRVDGERA